MLSAKDIRNVKFSKSMGGYKQEEVDILLDKVEVDYEQYNRTIRELNERLEQMKSEVEANKDSQNSIQNVLVSAQRLADQIVDEAKEKSEQIVKNAETSIEIITAREKELTEAFDRKASERKAAVEKEINEMLSVAEKKAAAMEKAAADSVARQQMLFDKLKIEISAFKSEITQSYREHLEILQKLPDEVPMDPKTMAEAVSAAVDKAPDVNKFIEPQTVDISSAYEEENAEPAAEEALPVEEPVKNTADAPVNEASEADEFKGFIINAGMISDEEE